MASSQRKKAPKKSVKRKAQTKKAARPKAPTAKAKKRKPAKKTAAAPKKSAAKAPAKAKKAARPERPVKANGARKNLNINNSTTTILPTNYKQKRLDPFPRGQKDKLLQLRDAMVDSMAGVAKDNLRSRAEGSEASAFGMHQADAGSDRS